MGITYSQLVQNLATNKATILDDEGNVISLFEYDSAGVSKIYGQSGATAFLYVYATSGAIYPHFLLKGQGDLEYHIYAGKTHKFFDGSTRMNSFDYASNVSTISGGSVTGDDNKTSCNTIDTYPYTLWRGNQDIIHASNGNHVFQYQGTQVVQIGQTGEIFIAETSTPTAVTNWGAIYTKNDNKLYFQDGAGTEHEVAFV